MALGELTSSARRLALVGLAKNTGKTVALSALLDELRARGAAIAVTSVGRDGEERDVIDARIAKPLVHLHGGALVATTDELLRASGLPHDLLEETGVRTPLGRVLVARLRGPGTVEVAGPSAAADVRAVSDAMLAHGAEQVLIDGAVDRRAASSPEVSDGLVIATGAVLSRDLDEVVRLTADAVELVRLRTLDEDGGAPPAASLTALAGRSALLGADGEAVELDPRFVLTADAAAVATLLGEQPQARWLTVAGALPESFVAELGAALRAGGRELSLLVGDSTKVFLAHRGPQWYARQGVHIRALHPISLRALTVNPVAPRSHEFDSARLRSELTRAIPDVAVFDVLDPGYGGPGAGRPAPPGAA